MANCDSVEYHLMHQGLHERLWASGWSLERWRDRRYRTGPVSASISTSTMSTGSRTRHERRACSGASTGATAAPSVLWQAAAQRLRGPAGPARVEWERPAAGRLRGRARRARWRTATTSSSSTTRSAAPWRNEGLFQPLEDVLGVADGDFVGASLASYRHSGHLWGLPVDGASHVALYRPDLLDGPVPTTWPEVHGAGAAHAQRRGATYRARRARPARLPCPRRLVRQSRRRDADGRL